MEYIIIAALLELGIFGLLFGLGLAMAARKFAVEVDPRVELIASILPNANCGACGFPGCSGFSKAVVSGQAKVNGCTPGGQAEADKIAEILGIAVGEAGQKMVAIVACNGGIRSKAKFEYDGISDCRAAVLIGAGPKMCSYGCVGFGTCVNSCPFGALTMGQDGLPINDFEKCTGCGICVKICPTRVLRLVPKNKAIFVACNSLDKGIFVRKACESGCIACMLCQKNCQYDAIHVVNNLAQIDFEKCTECGVCIEVCPTKTILDKFPAILEYNKGIPIAVPINADETKKLISDIKAKEQAAKASAKPKTETPSQQE